MSKKQRVRQKKRPSAKSLANLKPWPPGVSGNPKGRPPNSLVLSEAYRNKLQEVCPDDPDGRTWADVIGEKMVRLALRSVSAAAELADRVEGKAPQHLEVSRGKDNAPPPQVIVQFGKPGELPEPDELSRTLQNIGYANQLAPVDGHRQNSETPGGADGK